MHVHLDLYRDHAALIAESDRLEIATLTVTTTPKAWSRNRELAAASNFVRVALGLHPQLVADRADEIRLFERLLPEARYVGEIGLDAGPRFYRSFPEQEKIFERILQLCAEQGGKILTIHSVRASAKIIGHLERHLADSTCRTILHWFTGTPAEARRAIELGCYFSINIEMLKSEKHAALVRILPIDRLLTETDGPFVEGDGRPVRPFDVVATVGALAKIRGENADSTQGKIVSNLRELAST